LEEESMSRGTKGARRPGIISVGTLAFAGALAVSACGFHPHVHSIAAPDARFAGRTTFRVLDLPTAHNGANGGYKENGTANGTSMAEYDPMRENSISALAIRDQLRKVFEDKGYRYSDTNPDFEIAYYATIRPVVDFSAYNYGYDYAWVGWPRSYGLVGDYDYDEGMVVVDIIDAATKKLLWRGQSTAEVSHDPDKYTKQLRKAVNAIQKRYPAPSP
jgi:hypothetical protein